MATPYSTYSLGTANRLRILQPRPGRRQGRQSYGIHTPLLAFSPYSRLPSPCLSGGFKECNRRHCVQPHALPLPFFCAYTLSLRPSRPSRRTQRSTRIRYAPALTAGESYRYRTHLAPHHPCRPPVASRHRTRTRDPARSLRPHLTPPPDFPAPISWACHTSGAPCMSRDPCPHPHS